MKADALTKLNVPQEVRRNIFHTNENMGSMKKLKKQEQREAKEAEEADTERAGYLLLVNTFLVNDDFVYQ